MKINVVYKMLHSEYSNNEANNMLGKWSMWQGTRGTDTAKASQEIQNLRWDLKKVSQTESR